MQCRGHSRDTGVVEAVVGHTQVDQSRGRMPQEAAEDRPRLGSQSVATEVYD